MQKCEHSCDKWLKGLCYRYATEIIKTCFHMFLTALKPSHKVLLVKNSKYVLYLLFICFYTSSTIPRSSRTLYLFSKISKILVCLLADHWPLTLQRVLPRKGSSFSNHSIQPCIGSCFLKQKRTKICILNCF